ncbi:hypothetical protein CYY_010071, partial [Polysphondylium violaceum]
EMIFSTFKNRNTTIKSSYSYKEIISLEWIISNNKYYLLKDKIKNQCNLIVSPNVALLLFNIKDSDIFQLAFDRYRHYLDPSIPLPVIERAADKGNLYALKMLVEMGYKIKTDTESILHSAIKNNDFEMLQYLVEVLKLKSLKQQSLLHAIQSKNIEIIEYLLHNFARSIQMMDKEFILKTIAEWATLDILLLFKGFYKEITVFEYTRVIFPNSFLNISILSYIFDNNHLDTSIRGSMEWIDLIMEMIGKAIQNSNIDVIKYLVTKVDLPQSSRSTLYHLAFQKSSLEIFYYLLEKNLFTYQTFYLSDINMALVDVDSLLKYLKLGVKVGKRCLLYFVTRPYLNQEFNTVWEKRENPTTSTAHNGRVYVQGTDITLLLIQRCLENNNVFVLDFLFKNDFFPKEPEIIGYHCSFNDSSVPILQFYLSNCPHPPHIYLNFAEEIQKAIESNSIKLLDFLCQELLKTHVRIDISKLYGLACQHSCIPLLRLLKEKNISPSTYSLSIAGSPKVIEFISKNYSSFVYCISDLTLSNAISNNRLACVQYLMENHFSYFSYPSKKYMRALGESGSLDMIKYFYRYNDKFVQRPSYQLTFDIAFKCQFLDILKFLFETEKCVVNIPMAEKLSNIVKDSFSSYAIKYLKK